MKKIYFMALALIAFSANAQFEINFDNMSLGDVSPQSPYIEVWPAAGATDAQVTFDQAYSGDLSMNLRPQPAPGNVTYDDVIVLLGGQTSGIWTVRFYMYVTGGNTGFWNIQDNEIAGIQWNGQFFVGATASGGSADVITHDQTGATVPYPSDVWFQVKHEINLDNMTQKCWVNDVLFLDDAPYVGGAAGGSPANALGSINFFSIDTQNNYYIDDFKFAEGVLSTNDFAAESFSVYPNPVVDQLNIKSNEAVSNIAVYNVLGSLVYQSAPNAISPSIDMSSYKSGVYFVEVTINNSKKTVKIVK